MIDENKIRTAHQNASLHLYLEWIAKALADSGQDMRTLVKIPIRPTMENCKENLFKPVMRAMYPDKKSTKDLTTKEMQNVYEVFNSAMSERLGVGFDWPSEESLMWEQESKRQKRQANETR